MSKKNILILNFERSFQKEIKDVNQGLRNKLKAQIIQHTKQHYLIHGIVWWCNLEIYSIIWYSYFGKQFLKMKLNREHIHRTNRNCFNLFSKTKRKYKEIKIIL